LHEQLQLAEELSWKNVTGETLHAKDPHSLLAGPQNFARTNTHTAVSIWKDLAAPFLQKLADMINENRPITNTERRSKKKPITLNDMFHFAGVVLEECVTADLKMENAIRSQKSLPRYRVDVIRQYLPNPAKWSPLYDVLNSSFQYY
jgi:hypothetical protein